MLTAAARPSAITASWNVAVFTVAGASKAAAVAALLRGDDLPAARVHAGRTLWLVDGAARADAP